ncbi:MAG: hypothetical protein IPK87_03895 [Planctomycetes bacterium]|nr:hypothetical protein [Planctomycetota bacterium]
MPKISFKPVDRSPAPSGPAMFVKMGGMLMLVISMVGVMYVLLQYSYAGQGDETWAVDTNRIKTNFDPLLTTEEIKERFEQKRREWERSQGITNVPAGTPIDLPKSNKSNEPSLPFGNREKSEPDAPSEPVSGTRQSIEQERDAERDLQLAREQLKKEHVFKLEDESQNFLDWVPFEDASREKTANEFAARRGRQAPVYERLSLQVLKKLPGADYAARIHTGVYLWGESQAAADAYRGLGFGLEGRLFDLYEVRPEEAIVLQDGTKVEGWFEGAVALLDKGLGRNEHPVEHRVVIFMALTLPDSLAAYVGAADGVSHEDKLVSEVVTVKLTGAYARRWAYSREVKPYSTKAKRVLTQAHAPLLLTPDVTVVESKPYEVSDPLLQQVRDSMREDPMFLETEGAYYAILAAANRGDELTTINEIGYFDLAGAETGPRYRGQGVHVEGMIGDEYLPVILPPNISGLRRVFRAYVVNDMVNLESEKLLLVDMIEPPTGLEPRAAVRFEARYYRNVFETDSTSSRVRPLLIVKRVLPFTRKDTGSDWVFVGVGIGAVLLVSSVLLWFVLADRRERKTFEQSQLDLSRKRMEKRGGLKLKPLPASKPVPPDEKADPPAPSNPPPA